MPTTNIVATARNFVRAGSPNLYMADTAAFKSAGKDFTIASWGYITSGNFAQVIASRWAADPNNEWAVRFSASANSGMGSQFLSSNDGTAAKILTIESSVTGSLLNRWNFLAAVVSAADSSATLYVNSAYVATTVGFVITSSVAKLMLGSQQQDEGSVINGTIGPVAYWDRALSAAELATLYGAGTAKLYHQLSGTLTNNCVAYWDNTEKSGSAFSATTNAYVLLDSLNNVTHASGVAQDEKVVNTSNTLAQSRKFLSVDSSHLFITDASQTGLSVDSGGTFYIAGWFNLQTLTQSNQDLLGKWDTNNTSDKEYLLYINSAGNYFRWYFGQGGAYCQGSSLAALSSNYWYFVQAYYAPSSQEIGLSIDNGAFFVATQNTGPVTEGTAQFKIASRDVRNTGPLSGLAQSVCVYNQIPSVTDRAILYNSGASLLKRQISGTLTNGLVSYWDLNESFGSANDRKGSNTLSPYSSPMASPGNAKYDAVIAASFNSANVEYLACSSQTYFNASTCDYYVGGWVNMAEASTAQNECLFFKGDTSGSGTHLAIDKLGNNLRFVVIRSTAAGSFLTLPAQFSNVYMAASAWYYVAGEIDSATTAVNLYLNNSLVGTTSGIVFSEIVHGNTFPVRFGFFCAPTPRSLNGKLSNWHIFRGGKPTAAERAFIYNSGFGLSPNTFGSVVNTTNLVGYWIMDETVGNRVDMLGLNNLIDNNTVGYGSGVVYYTDTGGGSSPTAPDPITTLSVNTSFVATTLGLTWTAPGSGGSALTAYLIDRGTGGGSLVLFDTISPLSTSYIDLFTLEGREYGYGIRATNDIGTAAIGNTAWVIVPSTSMVVQSVAATTSIYASTLALSWSAPANDGSSPIISYRIERSVGTGNFTLLNTVATAPTLYIDSAVVGYELYSYRMYAINGIGTSAVSTTSSIVSVPSSPYAIMTLMASLSDLTTAYIEWTPPSNGGSAILLYDIFRAVGAGTYGLLYEAGPTVYNYTDTTLSYGNTYNYKAYAVNAIGTSGEGNIITLNDSTGGGGSLTKHRFMLMRLMEGL